MSTKRTATESNVDENNNENSDSSSQQEDNAKRARLDSLSDTTLEDLPMELLESILVKAVVMEVKGLKLVKSLWRAKADLAIRRLMTVSPDWKSVLTTNYFRNKVYGILDDTAEEQFRLETMHQSPIQSYVTRVATMKDEIFMLCRPDNQDPFIEVYDRNNMALVKDVIQLPGVFPENMAACSVSNCVYVLNKKSQCLSVLRITSDKEHQFDISPWINDLSMSFGRILSFIVSAIGNLVILSEQTATKHSVVSIYDVNGSLQHLITLIPAVHCFKSLFGVIQKSSGNLVLACTVDDRYATEFKEIDTAGTIVHTNCPPIFNQSDVSVADAHDRIVVVCRRCDATRILDSEFNLLDSVESEQCLLYSQFKRFSYEMHYNSERNEIVRVHESTGINPSKALTIFRFKEE